MITLLLFLVVLIASSCDDDETNCSETGEDEFIETGLSGMDYPSPIHPAIANDIEDCNPMWSCECNSSPSICTCEEPVYEEIVNGTPVTVINTTSNETRSCRCLISETLFESCTGFTIVFDEGCTRSPFVEDNGLLCGDGDNDAEDLEGCSDPNECTREDGFHPSFHQWANTFGQCFVGKYLYETGGDYTDLTSYFPLPQPNVTVHSTRCDGAPDHVTHTYTMGSITFSTDKYVIQDCVECADFNVHVNDAEYNYRQDPDCGREVDGSAYDRSFCYALVNRTTE